MFRFFKNIFNTFVIVLAIIGLFTIIKQNTSFDCADTVKNLFSFNKEEVQKDVGDFSQINNEFKIDKAVNLLGYKTVVAKHENSGQKMIIIDSGKRTLLKESDLTEIMIKERLNEMCKKLKYENVIIENIKLTQKGYMKAYGQNVKYVKFNAKLVNFPRGDISGIISVVDENTDKQKVIISINDNKHYSQLITTEFYKNVNETRNR